MSTVAGGMLAALPVVESARDCACPLGHTGPVTQS